MTDTLSKRNEKVTIRLGETDYVLSPMNMNVLTYIEEEFGVGLDGIGTLFETGNKNIAGNLRTLIHILLRDNHPEVSKFDVGRHILPNQLDEIIQTVSEALSVGLPEA